MDFFFASPDIVWNFNPGWSRDHAAKYKESRILNSAHMALNPILTGLCHVITLFGLIQPIAGMNRVKPENRH